MAWVWTLGAIAAVIAVIAALGGFGDAPNARRSATIGSPIDTGKRIWVVHGVELTDKSRAGHTVEPSLRLNVTITNLDLITDIAIDKRTVEVVLPDGSLITDVPWRAQPRSFGLQPDVPANCYAEIEVDPARVLGGTVIVRIRIDEPTNSVITNDTWRVGNDAVDVAVPVVDTREER